MIDPDDRVGFRIDRVSFGGGVAGALMALAAIGTLLSGLPQLWWLVLPPVVLGAIYGVARAWFRRR
jgi:membrane-associated phospholipid phosphatase